MPTHNVTAVAAGDMALILGLCGIRVEEVATRETAEAVVGELLEGGCDVLIIQDKVRALFSEFFETRLTRHRGRPLVVACPSFEEEESDVDAYLNAVLKPAIGYEIRLES